MWVFVWVVPFKFNPNRVTFDPGVRLDLEPRMEEQLKPIIARCQTCQTPTERRCSVCNVCIYCSSDCEAKAATMCFADVACELHRSLPYEDANLGPAAAHFLMLPSTPTDLTKRASPQHTAVDGAAQRRRALPAHPPSCLLALARGSQDRLRHGRRAHARVSLLVRLPADQLSLWQDEPGGGGGLSFVLSAWKCEAG